MRKSAIILLYTCLLCIQSYAQNDPDFCKIKSVGDTIFKETFPFTVDLSTFRSNFTPSVNCPAPGTYSMGGELGGCPFPTGGGGVSVDNIYYWRVRYLRHVPFVQPTEPTTSAMLINAGINRGIVYQRHVSNICGSVTYMFYATVYNATREEMCDSNAISPTIHIIIQSDSGDTLMFYNETLPFVTGFVRGVPKPTEQHSYCIRFTTPPGVTGITATIASATPSNPCGSYFAVDDIRLNAMAPVYTSINEYGDDIVGICKINNDPVVVKADISTFRNPLSIWQVSNDSGQTFIDMPGQVADSLVLPNLDTGMHIYRIQASDAVNFNNRLCRVNSYPQIVYVQPAPVLKPPTNLNACLNHQLMLNGNGTPLHKWLAPGGATANRTTYIVNPVTLNDSGIYVVTQNSGEFCVVNDSFIVKIIPPPNLAVASSFKVCDGNSVQLLATGDGAFFWKPANGLSNPNIPNPVATITDTTRYKVYLSNDFCADSARVTVNVIKKMQISAGPDMYILTGDSVALAATITGGVENFYWLPAAGMVNSNTLKPTVSPTVAETTYTLNATAANGCGSGSDDVTVYVYNDVYVPNAFTPNGDGKNDVFIIPPFSDLKVKHLSIYNRWGKLVFNNTNPGIHWDGTINGLPQPIGAYIYFIELVTPKGKLISRKGTLMLLR